MFDGVFGMLERCTEMFGAGVRDAFGASISADVLEPLRNEIGVLRSLHEDMERHFMNVEQVLQEARSLTIAEGVQQ